MSATDTFDAEVIVVGLGAVGAALVFQLAEAGVRVIGLERFGRAHAFGSSHGETRITRDYPGEGDEYVPLVARSHRIWADLARRGHAGLREQCGLLVMARAGAGGRAAAHRHGVPDFLGETVRIAERFGPPATMLDAAALRSRFPQFVVTDDTVAYFDPRGGYVRPEACVRAQLAEAETHAHATLRFDEPMASLTREGEGVAVTTVAGVYRAPRVVMCTGAWTPGLAGGRFAQALVVRPQVQYWFRPTEPDLWARAPAYIWFHGEGPADMIYGFPLVPGGVPGVKAATEQEDVACSPDQLWQAPETPLDGAAEMYARHIAGRLRGLSPEPVQATACLYTLNEGAVGRRAGFLIGPHPAVPGVTVVSACSGHGFKHSAGLGEALAERLAGLPVPELEPFDLPRA